MTDIRQQLKDLIDKHTYAVLQEGKSGITRETLIDEHLALISQTVSSVIGEDEIPNPEYELDASEYGNNPLRAKQRTTADRIFGRTK